MTHGHDTSFIPDSGMAGFTDALAACDYTVDAVLDRLGQAGREGLTRNQTVPALEQLGSADDLQAQLIRLFPLQQTVTREQLAGLGCVDALVRAGILGNADGSTSTSTSRGSDGLRALVDIRPYGFTDEQGEWTGWVAADPIPGMDSRVTPTRHDYVLGVSPASTSLAQLTVPTGVGAALDLGAGCGVQSLHLARHAKHVTLTDVNPRALAMARFTLALNGITVDDDMPEQAQPTAQPTASVRSGSLYEPVAGEHFDLIVTNPPYVMSPPTAEADRLVYREGGFDGDGLVHAVVSDAPAHLNPGGLLQVLANWADTRETSGQERVAGWAAGSGCDLWVLEREHLDVHSYIEMWLTDAGLSGSPGWNDRYREWLAYFDAQGITGVGMGWIMLRKGSAQTSQHAGFAQNPGPAQNPVPRQRLESWPYSIQQPVGQALANSWAAGDVAELDDDALLARRFTLNPAVIQETTGRPGAAQPEHVVLRQQTGLCRAMTVDAALGGVLGACDGELPLGVLINAVAELLDEPADELEVRLLPRLREAVEQGFVA